MKLYHASSVAVEHPDVAHSRPNLDYVAACRHGDLPAQQYDAVEGGIANDKVFNTVDLYFAGVKGIKLSKTVAKEVQDLF